MIHGNSFFIVLSLKELITVNHRDVEIFFLWGHLADMVFANSIALTQEFKDGIRKVSVGQPLWDLVMEPAGVVIMII